MAPDYVAELALIELSRMQRAAGYDFAALEAYVPPENEDEEDDDQP